MDKLWIEKGLNIQAELEEHFVKSKVFQITSTDYPIRHSKTEQSHVDQLQKHVHDSQQAKTADLQVKNER